jgi:DTW domain-containing protein YfiP
MNAGYRIERSVVDPDYTSVVYFPVQEGFFDRSKDDVSVWEQTHNAADMQRYWADNSVSITVTFKAHESAEVRRVLEAFETQLKSVSFLPLSDHRYEQAPYQEIDRQTYLAEIAQLRPVVWQSSVHEADEKYCTNDTCVI